MGHESRDCVIGIIVGTVKQDLFGKLQNVAFAIPSEILQSICPELKMQDICPYRGLFSFKGEDEYLFFGREKLVQELGEQLRINPRFLAVVGSSGSGKSSLFSPDGKYIATASDDNTARLWDAATGNEILVLNHGGGVNNVVFSPDGKYVATASWDKTSRLWVFSSAEDLIKEASSRLTRNLNQDEWKQYMGDEPYHETFPNLP